jgi:hypothetical protein
MAAYWRREVVTTRVEYVLNSPANWAEVSKAFAAVHRELGEDRARWDDAAWVEARDEEVVVWFEKSKAVTP